MRRKVQIAVVCALTLPLTGGVGLHYGDQDYTSMPSWSIDDEITISMWVKADTLAAGSGSANYNVLLGGNIDSNNKLYFMIYQGGEAANRIHWQIKDGGTWSQCDGGTNVDEVNKWYHLVVTFNPDAQASYVNGALSKSVSPAIAQIDNYTSTRICQHPELPAGTGHFDGIIDDVLIWNRSLGAAEIAALYGRRNAWYPRNGLVWESRGENTGRSSGEHVPHLTQVVDRSPSQNHGTATPGAGSTSMTVDPTPTRQARGRR